MISKLAPFRRLTLYNLNAFQFFEICFMPQNVVCRGECFAYTCKERVLCCHWAQCSINVRSSWSPPYRTLWFSVGLSCHSMSEGYWALPVSCFPRPWVVSSHACSDCCSTGYLRAPPPRFWCSSSSRSLSSSLVSPKNSCHLLSDT